MTDSPRLEEVFAAVLAEHAHSGESRGIGGNAPERRCRCGAWVPSIRLHQAERLAARFEVAQRWEAIARQLGDALAKLNDDGICDGDEIDAALSVYRDAIKEEDG